MTTALGLATKREVERSAPSRQHDKIHVAIGGLTNGYMQYLTTPAEYQLQGYEGATNLYGPAAGPLIQRVQGALAKSLADPAAPLPAKLDRAGAFAYWLGPERERFPRGSGELSLTEAEHERRALHFCALRGARPLALCFIWLDAAPGVAPITDSRWLGLETRSAAGSRLVLDDRGTAFRTRVHGRAQDLWVWSSLVQPSELEWQALRGEPALRVVVGLERAQRLAGPEFSHAEPGRDCSVAELRYCGL